MGQQNLQLTFTSILPVHFLYSDDKNELTLQSLLSLFACDYILNPVYHNMMFEKASKDRQLTHPCFRSPKKLDNFVDVSLAKDLEMCIPTGFKTHVYVFCEFMLYFGVI